ncbi:putative protein kinase RLK-Pelle-CR4L family [Helianthus annuus]|nr:putative protein kinase RLK-Pelle-CR4L family [Helianthus annuus]KAJ0785005.1 putative protein kinase RLK-Pelle-CR4L family [Helianthus annuus]KAJ0794269.1 putative protein kinase RLK-Pelle-CR4L family [Helianthus annuus]
MINRDKMSNEQLDRFKLQLKDIVEATNNFADEYLIRKGGFGKIYRGNLVLSGKPTNIVARRLHYDYGQDDFEFWNEISMLARLKHHNNLVSFIGYIDEAEEKIIINEYEVNGSLDEHLEDLTWTQRLEICVDVARALSYIHCDNGHESSVIHSNIKSSKILLDEEWTPKLAGFELAKENTKSRKHRLIVAERSGTIGYVDPTYEKTGFVSHKSDVYSFGVVLFEVLCGRRAFLLDDKEPLSPQFIEHDYKDGNLDVMEKQDTEEKLIVDESQAPSRSAVYQAPSMSMTYRPGSDGWDDIRECQPSMSMTNRPASFVNGRAISFNNPVSIHRSSSFSEPPERSKPVPLPRSVSDVVHQDK